MPDVTKVARPEGCQFRGRRQGGVRNRKGIVESGSKIVLDRDINGEPRGCVKHEATGTRTVIHERYGTVQFNLRVPEGNATGANRLATGDFQRLGVLEADLRYLAAYRP